MVADPQPVIDWKTDQEDDMPLTDKDIERIADAVAARVNRHPRGLHAKGEPTGPNKDNPQFAADYIRQIKNRRRRRSLAQ